MSSTSRFFKKEYCMECLTLHWIEIIKATADKPQQEICHGEDFTPRAPRGYYSRSAGWGMIEILAHIPWKGELSKSLPDEYYDSLPDRINLDPHNSDLDL